MAGKLEPELNFKAQNKLLHKVWSQTQPMQVVVEASEKDMQWEKKKYSQQKITPSKNF